MESFPIDVVIQTLLRTNYGDMATIDCANYLRKPRATFKAINLFLYLMSTLGNVNISGEKNSHNHLAHLFYNTTNSRFPNTKKVCDRSIMCSIRSFRQRLSSPMTSSPTYEVDSPTWKVSSPARLNYTIYGATFCPYTHINYSSFFHPLPNRTKKYFGFRSNWHKSVGELTFHVGESTSGQP